MKKSILVIFILSTTICSSQSWTEISKIIAITDRSGGDNFGYAVAIDGDYALIGARLDDVDASGGNPMGSAGAAYIFERDTNGNWIEIQKIVASDRSSNDRFGFSVSISGDYAIVGAPENVEGAVYVFKRSSTGNWSEIQKIQAADGENNDLFGYAVDISGNNIIVGAYEEEEDKFGGNNLSNAGSAYIFTNVNDNWSQSEKLVTSDREEDDRFGFAVSIDQNFAVVGAYWEDDDEFGNNNLDNPGSAYVFENISGNWTQVKKLVSSDRAQDDEFGYSVAIDGDFIVVGAKEEEEDATNSNNLSSAGSAYIFNRNSSNQWVEAQKLVASDRAVGDTFGYAVSITENSAIIGAYKEDHDSAGNNFLTESGAAYIFERGTNGIWNETEKLTASDRAFQDFFGFSVAIDSNYALVGAYREDNGVEEDNSDTFSDAGSAYVYQSSGSLSITDQNTYLDLIVYPNPTYGNISFQSQHNIDTLEIYALNGIKILTFSDLKDNSINLQSLTPGNLFLKI